MVVVNCPHAVLTVVMDKRFKESLTAKGSRKSIYSVYQKKGEGCSRELVRDGSSVTQSHCKKLSVARSKN